MFMSYQLVRFKRESRSPTRYISRCLRRFFFFAFFVSFVGLPYFPNGPDGVARTTARLRTESRSLDGKGRQSLYPGRCLHTPSGTNLHVNVSLACWSIKNEVKPVRLPRSVLRRTLPTFSKPQLFCLLVFNLLFCEVQGFASTSISQV